MNRPHTNIQDSRQVHVESVPASQQRIVHDCPCVHEPYEAITEGQCTFAAIQSEYGCDWRTGLANGNGHFARYGAWNEVPTGRRARRLAKRVVKKALKKKAREVCE